MTTNKIGKESERREVDNAFDRLSDGRIRWYAQGFQIFVPIVYGPGKVRE